MALSDDDVREILRIIDESDLAELRIETDGLSLHVVRGVPGPDADPSNSLLQGGERPVAEEEPVVEHEPAAAGPDGALAIESPMLGTFYRAPAPGAEPFVELGARVEPDTIVCIVEVMKMMNSIPAGVAGTIAEVCAANGDLVEYGQPLFRVEPAR